MATAESGQKKNEGRLLTLTKKSSPSVEPSIQRPPPANHWIRAAPPHVTRNIGARAQSTSRITITLVIPSANGATSRPRTSIAAIRMAADG